MATRVFALGNSHLTCMEQAYASYGPPSDVPFDFLNLNFHKEGLSAIHEKKLGLSDYVVQYWSALRPHNADEETLFVSQLGGNEHNVLGLIEHPRSFDFILPDNPDLPPIAGAEIVPYDYVRQTLRRRVWGSVFHIGKIIQKTGKTVVHLPPPPPIGDGAFVAKHLDKYFLNKADCTKVAASLLRWKLWMLQTDLARELCQELGAIFWASPRSRMDSQGFLLPKYFSNDATHGNLEFGQSQNEAIASALHSGSFQEEGK